MKIKQEHCFPVNNNIIFVFTLALVVKPTEDHLFIGDRQAILLKTICIWKADLNIYKVVNYFFCILNDVHSNFHYSDKFLLSNLAFFDSHCYMKQLTWCLVRKHHLMWQHCMILYHLLHWMIHNLDKLHFWNAFLNNSAYLSDVMSFLAQILWILSLCFLFPLIN